MSEVEDNLQSGGIKIKSKESAWSWGQTPFRRHGFSFIFNFESQFERKKTQTERLTSRWSTRKLDLELSQKR